MKLLFFLFNCAPWCKRWSGSKYEKVQKVQNRFIISGKDSGNFFLDKDLMPPPLTPKLLMRWQREGEREGERECGREKN